MALAQASRSDRDALRAETVTLGALLAEGPAWDDLAARARDPHPYYTRHVMAAHWDSGLASADLPVVVVRQNGRLEAVLPMRMSYDICGLGRPVAQPFVSHFVAATTPLVADGPGYAATLTAVVAGLRMASHGRAWRWPLLATESSVGRDLLDAMAADGWAHGEVTRFARPILDRRADHAAFLDGHPNRSRLKDLRRRQRRLGESGTVSLVTTTEGAALADAVEAFLALERAGWKGEAGTAMACTDTAARFARTVFSGRNGPVQIRADILACDGRPLAISLALVTGGTAFLLKTAYDETQRAQAPGLVLEAEIVRVLHETGFAKRLDSATLAGSALESLYRERVTIAEVVAVPDGGRGIISLERRLRLARFENEARTEAKRLLGRR
ncbi:GNAT family N-acetyltransferase [Methylobacterium sp. BTF04]|uniref:GNAT family N-acetyltransferase n=1 Tax=Methylobacterium sp. BTF04 TaxID=2708300 RepID=UPI001FEE10E9|nr:GNAT family N-acetyltransferase [Methylobacterium sp. BTF04]